MTLSAVLKKEGTSCNGTGLISGDSWTTGSTFPPFFFCFFSSALASLNIRSEVCGKDGEVLVKVGGEEEEDEGEGLDEVVQQHEEVVRMSSARVQLEHHPLLLEIQTAIPTRHHKVGEEEEFALEPVRVGLGEVAGSLVETEHADYCK
eukprot:CAMPEP_0202968124 /NCGR_PEP_ID=MMETSP1396-20130829/13285_1 /ASSEMBLY_ACC=CAM_ASM_000872 /TAXON_ID= /ORGANISM="Pseudokeronopsis sp., Strain Brazil" /LENGTH=147 /DNA_ID=CAMNT_0049694055 /DNA_START=108 /DNA_END=547 /DNA_ORIENTATION=-